MPAVDTSATYWLELVFHCCGSTRGSNRNSTGALWYDTGSMSTSYASKRTRIAFELDRRSESYTIHARLFSHEISDRTSALIRTSDRIPPPPDSDVASTLTTVSTVSPSATHAALPWQPRPI